MSLECVGFRSLSKIATVMIRTLQKFLAAAALALGFALPASAVTTGTDFTDLWWNPSEPGWGLNVIHQNGLIFATLYVYDAAGTPHFFSGSETRGSGNSFSGPLYETRGTSFTVSPYNAAAYGANAVGTITISFSTANSGTLYNVGATNVSKAITRFAFATDNLSGNYVGVFARTPECSTGPTGTIAFDTLRVTHNGNAISMTINFFNNAGVASTCNYSGTYSPMGRQGNISGSYNCNVGGSPISGDFRSATCRPRRPGSRATTPRRTISAAAAPVLGGVRDTQ